MSKVVHQETKQQRALYFSKNYGMVFGQGDLNINFDNIAKSSSKLGQTFQLAPGRENNETQLTGSGQIQFGQDIIELEVYALKK